MLSWLPFSDLKLDIVGIVAVLGEGSVSRNAQASALGWHHVLPRLLPAPQALLKHGHDRRLPTTPGTVVGAYSGNVKFELNFFCQLLHKDNLGKNEVELVEVKPRRRTSEANDQAYEAKASGLLALLSVLGCALSIGMTITAYRLHDGFALVAVALLSTTSSVVGFASRWRLDFRSDPPKLQPQAERQRLIPDSDVVIFYPRQGAFRIVRCEEYISRLYFRTEECEHVLGDTAYRISALVASIFMMVGLLCMSNSKLSMQLAFAAAYILLNALYWTLSALNPTGRWGHWRHDFECQPIRVVSTLPTSKPGLPPRTDTNNSFQNVPVLPQGSTIPTKAELRLSVNATTHAKSSDGAIINSSGPVSKRFDIRQRRQTFSENALSRSGAFVAQCCVENELVHHTANDVLGSKVQIVDSPTQIGFSDSQKVRRQNTVDLEGQKQRFRLPWGSAKSSLVRWLDKRRLIAKQPSDLQTNNGQKSDTFTTALWKAIIVTGSTRWLDQTHIAPNNTVWGTWIEEAGKRARPWTNIQGERVAAYSIDEDGSILLPPWDYQGWLSDLFAKEKNVIERRPPPAPKLLEVVTEERIRRRKVKGITWRIEAKLKRKALEARERAATKRIRRASQPIIDLNPPNIGLVSRVQSHDFATNGRMIRPIEE